MVNEPSGYPGIDGLVGEREVPASFVVYNFQGKTYADNLLGGGNDVTPGADAGIVINNAITSLASTGGKIFIRAGKYPVATQILLNKPVWLAGEGAGLVWNADTPGIPTLLQWTGAANNTPMIKILGSTNISAETDSWAKLSDIRLDYTGSATGTDGIYMDGENGLVRHIVFENVNVTKFTGSGIHAKGTTFDIQYYQVGVVNSTNDNVLVETGTPFTGNPSQHWFYGLYSSQPNSGKYAVTLNTCSVAGFFGGAIAGQAGGNGLRVLGSSGVRCSGVNMEGSGAGGTGLTYTGTSVRVEGGQIISWVTGAQIGLASATTASNWYVDSHFSGNTTDILVTNGGVRTGRIGPISRSTLTTLTNNRGVTDGAWWDVQVDAFPGTFGISTISVTASPFVYQNQSMSPEIVHIDAGTVSLVELTTSAASGTYVSVYTSTGKSVYLMPGQSTRVTYSSAPTMTRNRL